MLQINYPVKKKQNQVSQPKPSTGLTIPSPVHYTGKRNVELKRLQDPLRNHRMPFRIWHAGVLFNTEAGWGFWCGFWCFVFVFPNHAFFLPSSLKSGIKPEQDLFRFHAADYNHRAPSWLRFQHWQSIPVFLLPMHSTSTYKETAIKINDTEPQIPRSLLMNANIRLSVSGPHIRYRKKSLWINIHSRVTALPFSLK